MTKQEREKAAVEELEKSVAIYVKYLLDNNLMIKWILLKPFSRWSREENQMTQKNEKGKESYRK